MIQVSCPNINFMLSVLWSHSSAKSSKKEYKKKFLGLLKVGAKSTPPSNLTLHSHVHSSGDSWTKIIRWFSGRQLELEQLNRQCPDLMQDSITIA